MAKSKAQLESEFELATCKEIEQELPGCIILKNDAKKQQGILDRVVFYEDRYAFLEFKRASKSERQPNQEYFVERLDKMSFAAFIEPGNKEEVLDGLFSTLRAGKPAR